MCFSRKGNQTLFELDSLKLLWDDAKRRIVIYGSTRDQMTEGRRMATDMIGSNLDADASKGAQKAPPKDWVRKTVGKNRRGIPVKTPREEVVGSEEREKVVQASFMPKHDLDKTKRKLLRQPLRVQTDHWDPVSASRQEKAREVAGVLYPPRSCQTVFLNSSNSYEEHIGAYYDDLPLLDGSEWE
ncbi:hypothetical protein HK104_000035 [Borealophlyctis nickersoniae]|nr:hypothetical protein HK104_000035 [Borealophlyctis nickersoniae]